MAGSWKEEDSRTLHGGRGPGVGQEHKEDAGNIFNFYGNAARSTWLIDCEVPGEHLQICIEC